MVLTDSWGNHRECPEESSEKIPVSVPLKADRYPASGLKSGKITWGTRHKKKKPLVGMSPTFAQGKSPYIPYRPTYSPGGGVMINRNITLFLLLAASLICRWLHQWI